jgi:hypothetical protein
MKRILLFILVIQGLTTASAQNKLLISGQITDETGQPLPGAGVSIGGFRLGTVADSTGHYQLKVGPGNYNLIFQMLGYMTATANLVADNKPIIFNIKLKESITRLSEVVIRPERRNKKWEKSFRESFIGITPNAKACKILNPEVLRFEYNAEKKILTASTNDLLVVENKALGYRIKYLLKYFQKDEETGLVFFYGLPTFEELKSTPKQLQQYAKKRAEAYMGSPEHFFSALYKETLELEGFMVRNLVKKKNPRFIPEKNIDESLARLSEKMEGPKGYILNDVLVILKNKRREMDSVEVLSSGEFYISGLVRQKSDNLKTLRFDGALYVVYTPERERSAYRDSGFRIERPGEYADYQVSVINHTNGELSFYADGRIFDPASVIIEGHMAYERIADMVPRDYLVTDY